MKQLLVALTIVLLAMLSYVSCAERRERELRADVESQITRLAASVDRLANLVERVLREREVVEPGELYAAWYSGKPPTLIEVRTTQISGETDAQTIARHDAAVAAARAENPPILGA